MSNLSTFIFHYVRDHSPFLIPSHVQFIPWIIYNNSLIVNFPDVYVVVYSISFIYSFILSIILSFFSSSDFDNLFLGGTNTQFTVVGCIAGYHMKVLEFA